MTLSGLKWSARVFAKLSYYDTKDLQITLGANDWIGNIGGTEDVSALFLIQIFQCEFIIDDSDDQIANPGVRPFLDYDDIAWMDPGIDHRIALDGYQQCTGGLVDQIFIDSQGVVARVGSRCRKAGPDAVKDWALKESATGAQPSIGGGLQVTCLLEPADQCCCGALGSEAYG